MGSIDLLWENFETFGGSQGDPIGWINVKIKEDIWDHGPNDCAKFGSHRLSGLGGEAYEKFWEEKIKNNKKKLGFFVKSILKRHPIYYIYSGA